MPDVKPGVWQVSATRSQLDGSSRSWSRTASYCHAPIRLLQGYWGVSKLAASGCDFNWKRVSSEQFRLVAACKLLNGSVARSDGTLTLAGNDIFSLAIRTEESGQTITASANYRWLSGCSNP